MLHGALPLSSTPQHPRERAGRTLVPPARPCCPACSIVPKAYGQLVPSSPPLSPLTCSSPPLSPLTCSSQDHARQARQAADHQDQLQGCGRQDILQALRVPTRGQDLHHTLLSFSHPLSLSCSSLSVSVSASQSLMFQSGPGPFLLLLFVVCVLLCVGGPGVSVAGLIAELIVGL